jgi:AraC family transcriptional regulator, transcriptional activator of pobA
MLETCYRTLDKHSAVTATSRRQPTNNQSHPMQLEIRSLRSLSEEELAFTASPHNHEHFEVVFLMKGSGKCTLDWREFFISDKNICYIRPKKMHVLRLAQDAEGYIISFSQEFFHLALDKSSLSHSSAYITNMVAAPLRAEAAAMTDMNEILRKIECELNNPGLFKMDVLRSWSKIFLIYLNRLSYDGKDIQLSRKHEIVQRFLEILEESYSTRRTVADYASALCLSVDYLNEVVKKTLGVTTSHHIQQRVLLEAKRLSLYSNVTMKQIAYQLGFDDLSHFSKFFKNACGESFSDYRHKALSDVGVRPLGSEIQAPVE